MRKLTGTGSLGKGRVPGLVLGVLLFLGSALPASAASILIKPIQLCNAAGTTCGNSAQQLFTAAGNKIWAQAGIDLVYSAWTTINNNNYLDIDIGAGAVIAAEAQGVMTAGIALNNTAVTKVINMFFAQTLDGGATLFGVGCGGAIYATYCNNQVGVFINDSVFSTTRLDTLAHELGHVLNLPHAGGANNLMADGGTRTVPGVIGDITPDGADLDQLTGAEITTALASPYVVPEPATLTLMGFGLVGAFALRRRILR